MSTCFVTAIHEATAQGTPLVLVNVIGQEGSTPRGAGARMLVFPDASIKGTVGGGGVEAEAITAALELLRAHERGESGETTDAVMHFSLSGTTDMDMLCGGSLTLLFELILPASEKSACFAHAARLAGTGRPAARLTRILPCEDTQEKRESCHTRSTMFFCDGSDAGIIEPETPHAPPALQSAAAKAIAARSLPFMFEADGVRWFVEPLVPRPRAYIFGAGHVSVDTAALAARIGFRTVVVDDRPEFATPARFPDARTVVLPSLAEAAVMEFFTTERPGPDDAVIIITRGHAFDRDVLAATLAGCPAGSANSDGPGYIGMIGSRSKRESTYAVLRDRGISPTVLAAVHSPIGLDIGAQTPEEIAVSIVAELIAWRRGKLR
ncbi:XdhC family protein [Desulfovibrio sp. OttesenSCG-928-I05]|nr:XdhC family protein [Desulfovibrio sp. OttesenSCG-928-I05]